MTFVYKSGEVVKRGDHVIYRGEPGEVEFIVTRKVGDPALDWYLDQFPEGGFMVKATSFGSVFLTARAAYDDLELITRAQE